MNFIIFSIAFGVLLLGGLLYYKKWQPKHILSLTFSLVFMSIFAIYSHQILTPFWPSANASTLWVITFIIIYIGGAIMATLPFLLDGLDASDLKKFWKLLKIWIVIGLLYTVVDNSLYGPFAVGPESPYIGQNICNLPTSAVAEDVFFGCLLQKAGINPFGALAGHIVYYWLTIAGLLLTIFILGAGKIEKLIFNGEFK